MPRIIPLILLVTVVASHAVAQEKSPCTLLTSEDARTFFGKVAVLGMKNTEFCGYGLNGATLVARYTVTPNAKQTFDVNRRGLEQFSPKDEQGLGATAFSVSIKSKVMIYLLKGNSSGQLIAGPPEGTPMPAGMLDKLRVVAQKFAGRM